MNNQVTQMHTVIDFIVIGIEFINGGFFNHYVIYL